MTIAEIRRLEEDRQGKEKVIHLLKEGEWYRMHDWSTWLMAKFPMGDAKVKPLKVMAKKLKDGYTDAFCGFPCSSMSKYIPNDGTIEFHPVSDSQIDVTLTDIDLGEDTGGQLRQAVDEWKDTLPVQESTRKQRREDDEAREQAPRMVRFTDILNELVAVPMEDVSPKEAFDILRRLRNKALSMF